MLDKKGGVWERYCLARKYYVLIGLEVFYLLEATDFKWEGEDKHSERSFYQLIW